MTFLKRIKWRLHKNMRPFLCGLMIAAGAGPLYPEVFFTPRAQAHTEGMEAVIASWNAQAEAYPNGHMAAWAKKRGESGYIGDIFVDFDNEALRADGALGLWSVTKGAMILSTNLPEPYMSAITAHEAAHAYFDTKVPYIERILPPRYAVALSMIREICGYLHQAKEEIRNGDYYHIKKTITERPALERNVITYFWELHKYFADTNPGMNEADVYQVACNAFALGFLSNNSNLDRCIGYLRPQYYQLMEQNGRTYTPPVLNRRSCEYMANLDAIVLKYLQTAMPDGVKVTLDIGVFMNELSRQIDRMDQERAAKNLSTCAQNDTLFAQSLKTVESLGSSVLDGGMVISPEIMAWLDALVGRPRPDPQVVPTLRANNVYKDIFAKLSN